MNYEAIFEALNEVLREQKTTILVQQFEIKALKERIEEMEKKNETV